jgi:hypothetical protein
VISFDPKAKLISKDNIAALEACKIKEWLENALEPGEGGINADPELGEGAIGADHDENVVPATPSPKKQTPRNGEDLKRARRETPAVRQPSLTPSPVNAMASSLAGLAMPSQPE